MGTSIILSPFLAALINISVETPIIVMYKIACIPAFNEENRISDVIKRTSAYVEKVVVCDAEILINAAKKGLKILEVGQLPNAKIVMRNSFLFGNHQGIGKIEREKEI